MKSLPSLILAVLLPLWMAGAQAAGIRIDLQPADTNPSAPTMGEWMHFKTLLQNDGSEPIAGLVAWISLIKVSPGEEQPMDLEDWSAHKAVAGAALESGGSLITDWPLRLIQSGDYRVVVSATDRAEQRVYTSRTLQFHIARKPVVDSARILPVAFGVPLLIGALMGYNDLRRRRGSGG